MKQNELTNLEDWENIWKRKKNLFFDPKKNYLHFLQEKIFKKKFIPGDKKFIEIGCAPGRYLIYFSKNFGYKVSGIDFSKSGIEITKKVLQQNKIEANIIWGDFLQYNFKGNQYDIVFSAGFIEHFKDVKLIIEKMVEIARPGGIIFATIPNFGGLLGKIKKIFEPKIYNQHNPLTKKDLWDVFISCGLINVEVEYLGSPIIPVPQIKHLLFKNVIKIFSLINVLLILIYKSFNLEIKSSFLSPQIYAYGEKPI